MIDLIYLAGSANRNPEFSLKWRDDATKLLKYPTINPFRGKKLDSGYANQRYEPNEIVIRDINDVLRAKLVLAEMAIADYPYIGTCMEIRTAYEKKIPIVIWSECFAKNYWLRFHSVKILPTLEECCEYINQFWGD